MNGSDAAQGIQPDFYKSQYEGLRREIELNITESRSIERYAAIAVAVVWAWLATNGTSDRYHWFWFIPVILTILGILRSRAIQKHFHVISKYLRTIEDRVCDSKTEGWETFINHPENSVHGISRSARVFWGVLLLATLLVGGYGWHLPPPTQKESTRAEITVNCKP